MTRQPRSRPPRPGLTLMELVVVLAIIVAVTGIVSAILPNMIHRANVASCTGNISELDKIIQTYEGLYSQIPSKFDNLVIGNNLASYALTGANGDYKTAAFTVGTLVQQESDSFTNWGNTQVTNLIENPNTGGEWRPTFWPYSDSQQTLPTFTNIGANTNVAVLTQFGADLMGLPTGTQGVRSTDGTTGNYKYVIFGMNRYCTIFRNVASEPPFHFADTPTEDPASYYMCFGAVYMVSRDDPSGSGAVKYMDKARFMGSVAFHDFGLATGDSHTKEWWDQLKDDRPFK